MKTIAAFLVGILVASAALGYLVLANAYVVCHVWQWHVTPWLGVAAPSMWQAIAVALLVGLFSNRTTSTKKPKGDPDYGVLIAAVLQPWFALGLAWLIR